MATRRLNPEQVKEAIILREWEGWTQEDIAQKHNVSQPAVSKWEGSRWWQEAKRELLHDLWATAELVGLKGLLQQARAGDTPAAKELLNRIKGEVEQKLRIYDGDARDKLDAKLAALAARRREGEDT